MKAKHSAEGVFMIHKGSERERTIVAKTQNREEIGKLMWGVF